MFRQYGHFLIQEEPYSILVIFTYVIDKYYPDFSGASFVIDKYDITVLFLIGFSDSHIFFRNIEFHNCICILEVHKPNPNHIIITIIDGYYYFKEKFGLCILK